MREMYPLTLERGVESSDLYSFTRSLLFLPSITQIIIYGIQTETISTSSNQSSQSSSSPITTQSSYIYFQSPTVSYLSSRMNDDNEHLEEKRNRRQIPSEDPNSVDVDLSFISSLFHKEATKFSQLPTLPPSLFDFSLSSQLASSPLPDFDCYQPIILRPPTPLSLRLVIVSRERWWMTLRYSPPSDLYSHSPYETIRPRQPPKATINRFTLALCYW